MHEGAIYRYSKLTVECKPIIADVILLDQMMPGMSGEDTLNEMKEMDILLRTRRS